MVSIAAESITKNYRIAGEIKTVVESFNQEFHPGKIYCFYGESGSGKSTILKMLGLLSQPTSGRVLFEGKEMTTDQDKSIFLQKNIGWVLQSNNLIDSLSVEDNIRVGVPYVLEDGKILENLKKFRLENSVHKKASFLSGGEAQRVAFIRSIIKDPKILILDEFTSGLDEESEDILMSTLKEITYNRNIITLIASHSPRVKAISDYLIKVDSHAS